MYTVNELIFSLHVLLSGSFVQQTLKDLSKHIPRLKAEYRDSNDTQTCGVTFFKT